MKKNIFCIIIILFLFINFIFNTQILIDSTNNSIIVFKNNLLPTIFPIFIISDLLINYNFNIYINELFYKLFYKLFRLNKSCCFIFILGMITGYSNIFNIILNLYNQKYINNIMVNKIILFTNFINPIYLISILSIILNFKLAVIILLISIVSNIIIGIIYKNYNVTNDISNIKYENINFFVCLTNSIKKNINNLIIILGINIFISIISNIIFNNNLICIFFKGLLDFTNGLSLINNLSFNTKIVFSTIFISFGGINSHLQCINLLPNINYSKYLKARFLQVIISLIILIPLLLLY